MGSDKTVPRHIRFPADLVEWIEKKGDENGLNFSEMVRMMLTQQKRTIEERERVLEIIKRKGFDIDKLSEEGPGGSSKN